MENSPPERKHERILQVPPTSVTLNFSESIFLGEDIEPGYAVIDAGANGTRADCNLNDNEGGRKCGVCIGKLPPFQLLWDNIQTWERCCGVLSFRDYIPIRRIPQSGNAMIPPTCCHNPKNEDCQRNPNLFNSYIAWSCDMAIWNRIAESYEFVVTCLSFFQFYLCIFVILLVMAALLA
ncbi:unnamed protein product [Protopolystoma xenopodis]|uniref:Uncharacterized protein n=1 Tax=Protopolystoma xenopodis TaxID=117903 RepID=A0A3S5FH98_9PLAT|nr:unnamed protein product [Protopolystoma xenopodis]